MNFWETFFACLLACSISFGFGICLIVPIAIGIQRLIERHADP